MADSSRLGCALATEPNTSALPLPGFLEELKAEFPAFRLVYKEHDKLSKAIARALQLVTFGGQSEYLERYYTVIGYTLYVPLGWRHSGKSVATADDIDKLITLRHERVHMRQRNRYGMPLMTLLYLCWPLPLGLSYGRARIEWEAYTETLRATYQLKGYTALRCPTLRARIIRQFTGPAYGWMWPFEKVVAGWYDRAVEQIAGSV